MPRFKNPKKGFSLAEILIVVAILAVLVVIAIPVLANAIENAQAATCSANRENIERECTYEFMLSDKVDSYAERKRIADAVLAEYNSGGKMCPCGGTYTIGFIQKLPAGEGTSSRRITQESYQGYQVFITCTEHMITSWAKGDKFRAGDIMTIPDAYGQLLTFQCLRSHTAGSRSNTRNPTVKSNKGSWEVIGTPDGTPPSYNPTVRFSPGFVVKYNGNLYSRTAYNLTGGQTPYSKSSSTYWILLGPESEFTSEDAP